MPEKIDLPVLVDEIAEAQRMRGDKDIAIEVESVGHATVTADKSHLSNVLNNLIDNAIKYSGESVAINIKLNADNIEVADNGIGIPAKSLPYIFDKFYRVPHGNRNSLHGYIHKLRRTFRHDPNISIINQRGFGYMLTIKTK